MKVQELRDRLKTAERDTLEKMVVEMYKKFPRAKKEEEIDVLIEDVLAGSGTKTAKKSQQIADFAGLKEEILEFIENAYAGYYLAPNRVVPKHLRPKWRFQVKQYVKELEKMSMEDEHYKESVELITKLYKLLCTACGYYLFSSDDPFRSVGIGQEEFYRKVLARNFGIGYSEETIREMLLLAGAVNLDRNTLYLELEAAFLSSLKTSDVKYTAMRLAKDVVQEKEGQLGGMKQYDSRRYSISEVIREMCIVVLAISILLGEPEKEVTYFFKHYGGQRGEREVTLYVALEVVDAFGDDALWCQVYEEAVKAGISPREELQEGYESRKKNSGGEQEN